jgi:hypothetical protein
VAAIEAVTNHDVIAFLTAWADNTTPREAAAYVHFGMTSSDLLDTALALQLAEATDLLIARAAALTAALREHALAHRDTLRPGRTHGIHAEPDVWGHRVADFAFAMARCVGRLRRAREAVAVGKLSGAVGTYSSIDPAIEAAVMAGLGLRPADVSSQVVLRDGIAEWTGVLAITDGASSRGGQAWPAHRGQGALRGVHRGPEGQLGDAAQEKPGQVRADQRAGEDRASAGGARARGDTALARAGHLALLRRAGRAARRRHRHGLPA